MTEGIADFDDLGCIDVLRARFIGAIAHSISEIHVGAQAGDVLVAAAETGSFGQQIVDACFLRDGQRTVHHARRSERRHE